MGKMAPSLALQTKQEAQHLMGPFGYWKWYVTHRACYVAFYIS